MWLGLSCVQSNLLACGGPRGACALLLLLLLCVVAWLLLCVVAWLLLCVVAWLLLCVVAWLLLWQHRMHSFSMAGRCSDIPTPTACCWPLAWQVGWR